MTYLHTFGKCPCVYCEWGTVWVGPYRTGESIQPNCFQPWKWVAPAWLNSSTPFWWHGGGGGWHLKGCWLHLFYFRDKPQISAKKFIICENHSLHLNAKRCRYYFICSWMDRISECVYEACLASGCLQPLKKSSITLTFVWLALLFAFPSEFEALF